MKQKQYSPLSVAEMAVSLYAANEGYLDDVDANQIVDFEAAMHAHVNEKYSDLLESINATGDYTDEIEAGLKEAVEDFKRNGTY
jgi:F-type H+-transporting ATPase subunit alpha